MDLAKRADAISRTEEFVQNEIGEEPTGHDWWHADRVRRTAEGRCVQDGDRLGAMGAIGIARTFAYGGYVNRPIHDPHVPHVMHASADEYRRHHGTTINHFHEKLST